MNRKSLLAGLAGLLIAGTGTYALAQNEPAPAATPATAAQTTSPAGAPMQHRMFMRHDHGQRGNRHGRRMGMRGHRFGPGGAVIADLRGIERLYMTSGKSSQLPALYNDVLARTQDPQVRNYVYARLARSQARPADTNAAVATLRKSLDENLTRLNQRSLKPRPASMAAPTKQG